MSTEKHQPKPQSDPEHRQDLALDTETVKDLEPGDAGSAQVRGGAKTIYGCAAGQSDARLKQGIEPLPNALARLRALVS